MGSEPHDLTCTATIKPGSPPKRYPTTTTGSRSHDQDFTWPRSNPTRSIWHQQPQIHQSKGYVRSNPNRRLEIKRLRIIKPHDLISTARHTSNDTHASPTSLRSPRQRAEPAQWLPCRRNASKCLGAPNSNLTGAIWEEGKCKLPRWVLTGVGDAEKPIHAEGGSPAKFCSSEQFGGQETQTPPVCVTDDFTLVLCKLLSWTQAPSADGDEDPRWHRFSTPAHRRRRTPPPCDFGADLWCMKDKGRHGHCATFYSRQRIDMGGLARTPRDGELHGRDRWGRKTLGLPAWPTAQCLPWCPRTHRRPDRRPHYVSDRSHQGNGPSSAGVLGRATRGFMGHGGDWAQTEVCFLFLFCIFFSILCSQFQLILKFKFCSKFN
jgi:hypothetical protein